MTRKNKTTTATNPLVRRKTLGFRVTDAMSEKINDCAKSEGFKRNSNFIRSLIERHFEAKETGAKSLSKNDTKQSQSKCQTVTKEEAAAILKRIECFIQDFQTQGAELKEMSKGLADKSLQRNFLRLYMKQDNRVKEMYEITQELYRVIREGETNE